MRYHSSQRNIVWTVLLSILAALALNACGDANNVSGPPGPGPLAILTSPPLPDGTAGVPYNITLAPSGGTPPYTWSSPSLPNGLGLNPSTGNILGTPTVIGTTPTESKLQDSKGESVQKVLSLTVNLSPTALAIRTSSLRTGKINEPYADALGGTGGTTPYRWGLKTGSPGLPDGLTLSAEDGGIRGTPTVASNATHTFTLTDAASLTVEKSLQLSINAALSITTTSLPNGKVGDSYSVTLGASGGTGGYTWGLAGGSSALPNGLTLNPSTGVISGTPQAGTEGTTNHTFTVTDQTSPTAQTTTKTLQLIISPATPPPPPAPAPTPPPAPAPTPPSDPQIPPATINP